jgi:hypothetical protein
VRSTKKCSFFENLVSEENIKEKKFMRISRHVNFV